MASSKEYLEFILEQLPGSNDTSYRAMMGEFSSLSTIEARWSAGFMMTVFLLSLQNLH